MTNYARIQESVVVELIHTAGDIAEMFHPSLCWQPCGEEVQIGWLFDGVDFSAPMLDLANAQARKWEAIKAERDARKVGGINVDTPFGPQWFHSDIDSRIQHLGLKDRARDLLAAGGTLLDGLLILGSELVMWKTMGGTFVPITAQLAFDIVAAGADLDAQLFAVAEGHRVAMEALPDPTQYDFSGGWPARFEV